MRRITLLLLLIVSLYANHVRLYDRGMVKSDIVWLNKNIDRNKLEILKKLYNACLSINMSYTCMAIAWQESWIGEIKINEKTGDYGLTGINLDTYIKDNNLKLSYWEKEKLKTKLVVNDDFAIGVMIDRLKYWYKIRKGNWYKIWESYNAGFGYNPTYPKAIYNKIIALRIWLRKNNINLAY